MATFEVEPAAEREVFEARGAIDDGTAVVVLGGRRTERREGDGEGGVPGNELEGAAIGGIGSAEAVGVGVTEAGAKVWGQAEVGGEVHKFGEEEGAVRSEHEEAMELGGEGGVEAGADVGLAGSEGLGGGGEGNGEEGSGEGGAEEAEKGGVAEDHGQEGAGGGEAKVGAAAGEDAKGEEVAGLGEEKRLQLAGEAEPAVLGGVSVQWRAADDLGGRSDDGPKGRRREILAPTGEGSGHSGSLGEGGRHGGGREEGGPISP